MPAKQPAPTKGAAQPAARKPQPQQAAPAKGRAASSSRSASSTGERDENYALVSVLYHALQGAETLQQYIQDAREADDDELSQFFEETREHYAELANEAKQLLAARIEASSDEDEDEDDEEDEDEDDEDEEDEDEEDDE